MGLVGNKAVRQDFSKMSTERQRFRSFAERFVLERAATFRQEHVKQDAWAAIMAAKTAFNMINGVSAGYDKGDGV